MTGGDLDLGPSRFGVRRGTLSLLGGRTQRLRLGTSLRPGQRIPPIIGEDSVDLSWGAGVWGAGPARPRPRSPEALASEQARGGPSRPTQVLPGKGVVGSMAAEESPLSLRRLVDRVGPARQEVREHKESRAGKLPEQVSNLRLEGAE